VKAARVGIFAISNIEEQSKNTHLLLYVIKSRVKTTYNCRLPLIHISIAQKTPKFIKFGFAISSDELKEILHC